MKVNMFRIGGAAALAASVVLGLASCRQETAPDAEQPESAQAAKLMVGTSADYPPFAYYADDLALDGFDVGLIEAVGAEMGVEIEISDISFDGLYDSLRLGQIDAAVAAISVTSQRQGLVGFTDVYYVGEDAVLGPEGVESGAVTSIEDMIGRRVGVQIGSVYATRLESELVETGLMAPENVVTYADAGHAAADLAAGEIDLVWLDLLPAREAARALGLAIAGQGLDEQQFAIAVRQDDEALNKDLNEALASLQSSGQLTVLSVEHLGLEDAEILPLATSVPGEPVATTMPPGCGDGLEFVAHVTYDDHDLTQPPEMAPGVEFVKTWRVKNVGTCPWPAGYTLRYVQGNTEAARMGGQAVSLEAAVAPGVEVDLGVDLAAPLVPGLYVGFWEMADSDDSGFGERLHVSVRVVAPPTPTPAPTDVPVRDIVFAAEPTAITAGESTTFSWAAQGAQSAFFFPEGRNFLEYPVLPIGQRIASPNSTTTYVLRAVWPDGAFEERKIRIDVNAPTTAPYISWFSLTPDHSVALGLCVDLRWDVQGETTNVRVTANNDVLMDNAPLNGYLQHCPTTVGTMRYAVEAVGPGGSSRDEHDIDVYQASQPQPTATPVDPATVPPEIRHFDVQPYEVSVGGCVAVTWELAGGVQSFRITRNDVVVQDGGPYSGTAYDCLYSAGRYLYRLDAWNGTNQTGMYARDEQIITVR